MNSSKILKNFDVKIGGFSLAAASTATLPAQHVRMINEVQKLELKLKVINPLHYDAFLSKAKEYALENSYNYLDVLSAGIKKALASEALPWEKPYDVR